MKINKMTASFGKLENESIAFHDGLNVVCAPNESGKSTWCAFIKSMLYGVDSSERAKIGYLPDKMRYAPWSGAPMEGSMELTADNCDITIMRRTKTKSAPMRDFSAVYTGSNVAVEKLTGANCGEMLTGVSKDVFCRSAFVAQGAVAVTGSKELEKRINAIVAAGDEHSSYSEADERLQAWKRKRKYNRRGALPELELRIDDDRAKLEQLQDTVDEEERLKEQLAQAHQRCSSLETEVNESRRRQRKESLERLNRSRAELKQRSDEHDAALTELSARREQLHNSSFGLTEPDELEERIDADIDRMAQLKSAAEKKASPLLALIFFVLAAVGAALYVAHGSVAFIVMAIVMMAAAMVFIFRWTKAKQAAVQAGEARRQLLKSYHAASPDDIRAAAARHRELWEAAEEAEADERRSRSAYESAKERQAKLEEITISELDFSGGSSEAAQLGRELNEKRAQAERLASQLASVRGRLAAMGDPMVIRSELSSMEDEREELKNECAALDMAIETLKAADTEMQLRFSPELSRLASEYMAEMTGGRWNGVTLNRDFTAAAKAEGGAVAHEAEYLSLGTLDLMYLAVRLAVCELALPEGESCPLIIDDALVNMDAERTAQAMNLLRKLAEKRQVILFTCRSLE